MSDYEFFVSELDDVSDFGNVSDEILNDVESQLSANPNGNATWFEIDKSRIKKSPYDESFKLPQIKKVDILTNKNYFAKPKKVAPFFIALTFLVAFLIFTVLFVHFFGKVIDKSFSNSEKTNTMVFMLIPIVFFLLIPMFLTYFSSLGVFISTINSRHVVIKVLSIVLATVLVLILIYGVVYYSNYVTNKL